MKQLELSRDEKLIAEAHVSPVVLGWRGVFAILIAFSVLTSGEMDVGTFFVAAVIILLIILRPLIAILTTQLDLTSKRVVGSRGFIKTVSLDSVLNKVNTVNLKSGLIGKLLHYGNIRFTLSSGETYEFAYISHPDVFKNAIMIAIEHYDEERIRKQAQAMADAIKSSN